MLGKCKNQIDIPKDTHDTTTQIHYVYLKDTGNTKPIFIRGQRDTVLENSIEYIPSSDYGDLYNQFQELKSILLSKNIFKDSIPIDTFGYVRIIDTLQKNMILNRKFTTNIKIPEKTITINNTIYPKSNRQLYIGGGINVGKSDIFKHVELGIIYKNKKDHLFGITGGIDTKGYWDVGIHSYWKIKL